MQEKRRLPLGYAIAAFALLLWLQAVLAPQAQRLSYSEFKNLLYTDQIERVLISDTAIRGTLRGDAVAEGQRRGFITVKVEDPGLIKELETRGVTFSGQTSNTWIGTLLGWTVPVLLFVGAWLFISRRMQMGQGLMALGKNRAKMHVENKTGITFSDVAGQDEAKEKLQEVIEGEEFERMVQQAAPDAALQVA